MASIITADGALEPQSSALKRTRKRASSAFTTVTTPGADLLILMPWYAALRESQHGGRWGKILRGGWKNDLY